MKRIEKIEVMNFWLQNADKIGELPTKLGKSITKEEVQDLFAEIGGAEKKEILNLRDELKKEIYEEKIKRKEKIEFFKIWIYPILAPIVVAIIIFFVMNSILNPPKIVETSLLDYYGVAASTDVTLPFLISNPGNSKLVIFRVTYGFDWENPDPEGQEFVPIDPPIISPSTNLEDKQSSEQIVLNSAGQEGDSIEQKVTFKSPPVSDNLHTLTIFIDTNKGNFVKLIKLSTK